jgi:hypothetical protein
MTFAFINIHLDIHRIIIIMSFRKDRCFGHEDKASEKNRKKEFHASLCTKRREGVFRLRLKKKISSTAKQIVHGQRGKIYYKVRTNLHKFLYNYITKYSLISCAAESFGISVKSSASHSLASSSCTC